MEFTSTNIKGESPKVPQTERRGTCLLLAVIRNPEGALQNKSQMFFFPFSFVLDVSVSDSHLPFTQA